MLIDELEEIYQKRQVIEKLYYNILRKKKRAWKYKSDRLFKRKVTRWTDPRRKQIIK